MPQPPAPIVLDLKTQSSGDAIEDWAAAEAWLNSFEAQHGRPLRVLHIGNIANYAYVNAKIMRRHGIEADVLCNDFYHIMGAPEWEDAIVEGDPGDEYRPNWWQVVIKDFQRPDWFIQGPVSLVYRYHLARKLGQRLRAASLGRVITFYRWQMASPSGPARGVRILHDLARGIRRCLRISISIVRRLRRVSLRIVLIVLRIGRLVLRGAQHPLRAIDVASHRLFGTKRFTQPGPRDTDVSKKSVDDEGEKPLEHSGEPFFPLQQSDIASYRRYVPLMRRTFEQYDIVQAYTTSGMYPLLAGFKNFTAYELGTLRTIPFQDDAMGRICAWVYRSAPAVFITNVDCIQAAERLGIDSERAHTVPHAFDCEQAVEYVKTQRPSIPVDRDPPLFLAPARHHWKTGHNSWRKGNDLIIRATRTLKDKGHRFKVIFVEWGQEIDLSKQLIEDLEVTEFFEWHRPMSKKALWPTYLRAAGVIDQFVAPAMGGVALEALGLARPLITRLDVDACLTFFSSMPPVCNAGTTEAVAQAMEWVLSEPEEAEAQARAGQEWMQREHSTEGALAIQIAAYRGLIETSEQGGKPGDGAQSLIVG